jgi:hypothetical protein
MPRKPPVRSGTPNYIEWKGPWESACNEPEVTPEEWDQKWESLRSWLSKIYNLEPVPVRQRECYVVDLAQSERTLQVEVVQVKILTDAFLIYLQQWLRTEAPQWRIAIPTDGSDENLILVYPEKIRINPVAEMNLEGFCREIQPGMQKTMAEERRRLGLDW